MKIKSAKFITSSPDYPMCPPPSMKEFAFIGRSNVGKSSLLNMLTSKEGLAKVSKRPGHTTMINFFEINEAWSLVDLPGYGYARRTQDMQDKFNEFVSDYLVLRETLVCVFLLVDSKIPPQQSDLEFLEWLVENEVRFALIFTKTDKVKPTAMKKNIDAFLAALKDFVEGVPPYFACSAKNGKGRVEILDFIDRALQVN